MTRLIAKRCRNTRVRWAENVARAVGVEGQRRIELQEHRARALDEKLDDAEKLVEQESQAIESQQALTEGLIQPLSDSQDAVKDVEAWANNRLGAVYAQRNSQAHGLRLECEELRSAYTNSASANFWVCQELQNMFREREESELHNVREISELINAREECSRETKDADSAFGVSRQTIAKLKEQYMTFLSARYCVCQERSMIMMHVARNTKQDLLEFASNQKFRKTNSRWNSERQHLCCNNVKRLRPRHRLLAIPSPLLNNSYANDSRLRTGQFPIHCVYLMGMVLENVCRSSR